MTYCLHRHFLIHITYQHVICLLAFHYIAADSVSLCFFFYSVIFFSKEERVEQELSTYIAWIFLVISEAELRAQRA